MELADDLLAGATAAGNFSGLPARAIYHLVETGQLPVYQKGPAPIFQKK